MTFCSIKPLINSLKVPPQPFKVQKMTIYTLSNLNAYPYFWILWWKVMKESYVFGWLPCTLGEIELFLLLILCHDFRVSLHFDLLCHCCMQFAWLLVESFLISGSQCCQNRQNSKARPIGQRGQEQESIYLVGSSRALCLVTHYLKWSDWCDL